MKKLLFCGPVLTASGYGVHARQLLKGVVDCGEFDVWVESLRWGETPFLNEPELDWIRSLTERARPDRFDVCVQVTIPNEFQRKAPLHIGVTAGIEVDRVTPDWIAKCNSEVDLVVVPSHHSLQAFNVGYQDQNGNVLRLERPIAVVPEGVDTSIYRPYQPNSSLGMLDELEIPEKNFIFVGLGLDKPRGMDRKNVTRLVEWFCQAFAGRQDVGLILKTAIVNGSTLDFEMTKRRVAEIKGSVGCGEYPKIFILHGRLPDETMAAIYNDPRVVASVSLTHGEGFGLPLIEAAACGLPVVATDWSGHLDFLTRDGKKLFVPIAAELKEIPQECVWPGVMNAGSRWAEPSESDAKIKLQKMAMDSRTPREWATELAAHVATRYDLVRTSQEFASLVRRALDDLGGAQAPRTREDLVSTLREKVRGQGPSLVYTMPMSAGDVFLSTGVVKALQDKHPDHKVWFATSQRYFEILDGLGYELIEWQPWMQDVGLLEDIFDEVYTPNLAVQMTYSNWVHKGKGRNLIDEFATQCGVVAEPPQLPGISSPLLAPDHRWVAVHTGGQKSARAYSHWTELVQNIRSAGLRVVQVGAADDITCGEVDVDMRGKTNHPGLVSNLAICSVFVGIDSYPMHVAGALDVPVVALFGSSYANSTGPKEWRRRHHLKLLEAPSRNGCERACYKDTCKVDQSNPCINNIPPQEVYVHVLHAADVDSQNKPYQEYRPKIAGYTHILNPKTHGYPYIQSIKSMLGFCDEVIVIDGGSNDNSWQELAQAVGVDNADRLKIITNPWDPEEPGMDGMQKAFGRAMVSPDMEFLWQQDADEVVHEEDYGKIIDLCKRFPTDVDVLHLPVVELWGDDSTCRTDRHSWKWRLSRNNLRVTHGINAKARLMDPKTGRYYAKEGMSDGCEYIDMVTGEHLPHRGFYNSVLEQKRIHDPVEYGRLMNELFGKLPSVWHYSWADLERKVRNFREFWDNQWNVLYQKQIVPRFPEDKTVEEVAQALRQQGGEHGPALTFKLTRKPPAIMRESR